MTGSNLFFRSVRLVIGLFALTVSKASVFRAVHILARALAWHEENTGPVDEVLRAFACLGRVSERLGIEVQQPSASPYLDVPATERALDRLELAFLSVGGPRRDANLATVERLRHELDRLANRTIEEIIWTS
jgi:hypothetical protein